LREASLIRNSKLPERKGRKATGPEMAASYRMDGVCFISQFFSNEIKDKTKPKEMKT